MSSGRVHFLAYFPADQEEMWCQVEHSDTLSLTFVLGMETAAVKTLMWAHIWLFMNQFGSNFVWW